MAGGGRGQLRDCWERAETARHLPSAGRMTSLESPVDTVLEPMLETRKSLATPLRRSHALRGRRQFSLLIVRGDGVRVLGFNFPRPAALGALVAVLVGVSVFGVLLGDWVQLRALTREARTYQRQIAEQRALIDSFNERVAQLRQEVAGWSELQARIWDPFGPEIAPGGRDRGIGGGSLGSPSVTAKIATGDELERLMARAGKALASLPSRWPVRGAVNSEFGRRLSPWTGAGEFHGGLDIRAEKGTPVHAPARATVVVAGAQPEYGITVILDHGNDLRTVYGHLSRVKVKPGDTVERGDVIGLTGNTGRSSGPHLHYEILAKGRSVNPRVYLWD